MHHIWHWISADDERDPREYREYARLFKEGLDTPAAAPEPDTRAIPWWDNAPTRSGRS
jgi:hypothetical protein